jgi:two-component system CheB/CheR fusion protein
MPAPAQDRPKGSPLRVWNPGCSTGEETYSLAIVLKQGCEGLSLPDSPAIQVFATDLDHDAVEEARGGTFSAGIAADVSAERLARCFVREGEGYRIRKEIRDLVVFAPQNIFVDRPFTKLDILCCRNLLIYVNVEAQQKLLPLMHYALNPGGLLILGTAESIGRFGHLFSSPDAQWKVFQRREVSERSLLEMPAHVLRPARPVVPVAEKAKEPVMDIFYAAQRMLLDCYGPPSVVVTAEGDIIYVISPATPSSSRSAATSRSVFAPSRRTRKTAWSLPCATRESASRLPARRVSSSPSRKLTLP